MEPQEGKEGGKECCVKGKCCGAKALVAAGLVLLGGLGGFCIARCRSGMCPVKPASAPAQPTK